MTETTRTTRPTPIRGEAAGVPFVAIPPERAGGDVPTVVAWHLMDAPRTEAALAAALPLEGLDAWRIYLGLPMCGSRTPAGGPEEVMRLGYEDAVMLLLGPVATQAAGELGLVLAELRPRLGLSSAPLGLLGGSLGSAAAQLVMAESDIEVAAAVLVSPVTQFRAMVGVNERRYGVTYPWSEPSEQVARRFDFVARAEEAGGATGPATLLVVGEDDDVAGYRQPAEALHAVLGPDRSEVVVVSGMGHALAEEPGTEPAPQIAAAAEVDRLAVAWLGRHLRS
jgi:pimeloyl-ACP methyl ester carboxylesterase